MQILINPKTSQFSLLALLGRIASVLGLLLLLAAMVSLVVTLFGTQWPYLNWLFGLGYLSYGLILLVGGQVLLWMVAMLETRRQDASG